MTATKEEREALYDEAEKLNTDAAAFQFHEKVTDRLLAVCRELEQERLEWRLPDGNVKALRAENAALRAQVPEFDELIAKRDHIIAQLRFVIGGSAEWAQGARDMAVVCERREIPLAAKYLRSYADIVDAARQPHTSTDPRSHAEIRADLAAMKARIRARTEAV